MGKMKLNPKLLECLFGHHDFFTSGCARQCKRCRIIQLSTSNGWDTIELEDVENFNLENTSYLPIKEVLLTEGDNQGQLIAGRMDVGDARDTKR